MSSPLEAALADRYRIERELGQGGMATVYLAEDLKHHRKVAIKVLRPELAAALGPDRFLREIETTAALHHPHILPLYDSGDANGLLFYVMPLVEGESLHDRLKREKQLPLNDALLIAREVADALSYAHARGVIHRDIKPENILLASGHAVVADFGIAKAISAAGGETLTLTGMAIGTPKYMSPEQAAGEKEIDGRSDLYSLACVLYEMLTGQPPFTGPTVESVVRQHMVDQARPVSQLRPAVPPEIADVLNRALAKNPADRFSPAAHFAAALTMPAVVPSRRPARSSRFMVGLGVSGILAVIAAVILVIRVSSPAAAIRFGRTAQVTRAPGLEVDPALSPDGQSIAYAAGSTSAMQIYVRQVSGERTIALTNDTTDNFRWPRWSPDGTQIAYQANDGIYVVPALGGAPRRVTRFDPSRLRLGIGWETPIAGFDWSPDGSRIAVTLGFNSEGVTLVTVSTGHSVTLSNLASPFSPAWSPDGRSIAVADGNSAFVYGTGYFANTGTSRIWIVHLDGSSPTPVTADSAMNLAPLWSSDGRELFWISNREGTRDIYYRSVSSSGIPKGSAQRLTTGIDAQGMTLSGNGDRVAFSRLSSYSAIWSVPLSGHGPISISRAVRLSSGNEIIEDVDVSADGRWLAFDSDRNGNPDIYVMPASGGEARQLTTDSTGDFSADWSPDGRRILFHSLRNGNRDVYSVDADGSGLRQWTTSKEEELDPDWAPDNQTILFEVFSEPTERHGFGTMRQDGAESGFLPVPVGDFAHWSPLGRTIIYHAADGIRLRQVESGLDSLVVSNARDGAEAFFAAWSQDGTTLYYLARSPVGWSIRSVPATGGAGTVLVNFDDPTRLPTKYGFATDGKTFYLTIGAPESDIWVASLEHK